MKKTFVFALALMAGSSAFAQKSEWVNLSDGTFDHWHIYNHAGEPVNGKWKIVDKAYVFDPAGSSSWKVNDLISNENYEDFELELEWKIEKGGNSGIFYGVKEDAAIETPYMTGPEIQVLDNVNHPDAKAGKNGNRKAGSLYDMIPSANEAKPYGEWNHVRILKKDNVLTIWQNGHFAVTYPTSGIGWDAMKAESKFKDWKEFGIYDSGKIGLQDHGNVVSFKNIKVREL